MDFNFASAALGSQGLAIGVVVAVFLAGLRHGFDLDHIAAITDITSSQTERRRSFALATIYAAGHALVLVILGLAAILAGQRIPAALDSLMGRVIGATLIALGLYVVYSAVRFGRDFRIRSRWMLIFAGVRKTVSWLRRTPNERVEIEHDHEHDSSSHHGHSLAPSFPAPPAGERRAVSVATRTHGHPHAHVMIMSADPFTEYGRRTAFGVGMLHGIGAETPSQVVLFATAAGVGGRLGGAAVLGAFVAGLFLGNSLLATISTLGFGAGKKVPLLYTIMAGTTALVSVGVGILYVLGRGDLLPGFLGG